MHKLTVYYNNKKVGILSLLPQSEEFTFNYDEKWQKNGFSLSPELLLNNKFSNTSVKNFIANLLPEGDGLEKLTKYLQISKSNKYALIRELGNETSGALIFTDKREVEDTKFREIPLSELSERIKKRKEISIDVWDGKPRLSVAGIQEKLPIAIINGKYGLADGELASTHLLKFDKQVSTNLVINEYLSMKLARYAGLNVANCEIKNFDGELVLEVERFDRKIISENIVERKFVIDGCQALCVPVSYKYERNFGSRRDVKEVREGMSFKKLFLLATKCKVPLIAKKNIMEWSLINLCIGNSDAHGKNISFFKNNEGMSITPFYDIVNVDMYKDTYDNSLAMAISDEFDLDRLKAYDFYEFYDEHEIKTKQYVSMFNTISNKIIQGFKNSSISEVSKMNELFYNEYKKNILDRIKYLEKEINASLECN